MGIVDGTFVCTLRQEITKKNLVPYPYYLLGWHVRSTMPVLL